MQLVLDRGRDVPLYRQVVAQIHTLIETGALAPGVRLPTIRQLAHDLRLTRLTVHSAYTELQAQGLIESVVGRGTFVATALVPSARHAPLPTVYTPQAPASWLASGILAETMRAAERPGLISFTHAAPAPETLPLRDLRRAFAAALVDAEALTYGPVQGEASLRNEVSRLLLDRGVAAPPDTVLITSGAQQAIAITLHALTQPGDVLLAEAPTYPLFLELAALRGQRMVGIPRSADGLSLDALEAACMAYHPRLLYLVPTFHNPTGASLSAEQRAAVLRIAREYDLLVVEDDIYGFLNFDLPSPPPLKAADEQERVLYLTSWSKALAPGLRLGALVAPPRYLPELVVAKQSVDLLSSPVLQRALAEYLRRDLLPPHLRQVRERYRERRDTLLASLERFLPECVWTRPEGGLNVWVTLPEEVNEREFFLEALDRGVGVTRGVAFFAQPQAGAHMRLCFGALAPPQLEDGARLLGDVLRAHQLGRADVALRAARASHPLV
jgi:DNA-binding transcriptional MocR family regulator